MLYCGGAGGGEMHACFPPFSFVDLPTRTKSHVTRKQEQSCRDGGSTLVPKGVCETVMFFVQGLSCPEGSNIMDSHTHAALFFFTIVLGSGLVVRVLYNNGSRHSCVLSPTK